MVYCVDEKEEQQIAYNQSQMLLFSSPHQKLDTGRNTFWNKSIQHCFEKEKSRRNGQHKNSSLPL